jgi:hypothetical protein
MVSEEPLGEGAVLVAAQTKDSDAWREGQRAAGASEAAGSMQRPDALLRILHRGCGTACASRRRRRSADVVAMAHGLSSDHGCFARTAGTDAAGVGCPALARTRCDVGCMLAPLVTARTAAHPNGTRGHIHPPHDLARDEIDIHASTKIPGMGARRTPIQGRAQVVSVCVPAGIARRGVGLPPEKLERVRTHADPESAAPDGLLVKGIECLEALH